ncbi:hypothetical protein FF38_07808 [Lucilia cuprina]|uniref:Uncharacterized protein n=1 Tax=Lucilia cuprina TaxID=7375 RepID=A0A0L0BYP5_LUCCU|nr:transcription initiation factor TFIID subunit 1-like [Lucilia cuprina]KAI8117157.1 hypothetical protein CVS40_10910 [Lucilia cuprina]KNC25106.1 hypothetical protein FF38_07808 [Lucilia cuprina]
MKTIILVSLCLCLLASAITADKSHKHQGKLLKSGHEEHKKHADLQPLNKDEAELKTHTPTNEQAVPKTASGSGRKHRNNHHGKNKKGSNTEAAHTGRSRKTQTKPNKHNGQKSHNKQHGRKHGRGKQAQ